MNLTIIQQFDINNLENYQRLPELSDHCILTKGILSGWPVISLLTEEEMSHISENMEIISENMDFIRFIFAGATYLTKEYFYLPCALLDYAQIHDIAYIIKAENSKYFICSDRVAEKI